MTEIVMLDLETLDTAPTAAILSLALYTDGKPLHVHLDVDEQLKYGATISWSTVRWWLEQSGDARLKQTGAIRLPVNVALAKITEYCRSINGKYTVWSNGAAFDLPILRWHASRMYYSVPWNYGAERCYRTKRAEVAERKLIDQQITSGVAHDALDDARRQYEFLMLAEKLGYAIRS